MSNRYTKEKLLATPGIHYRVWSGRSLDGLAVAIKEVREDLDADQLALAQRRLNSEADILCRLQGKFVPFLYHHDVDRFIVMELAPETLATVCKANTLTRSDLSDVISDVVQGLEVARVESVIHCDMKPDNVLMFPVPPSPETPSTNPRKWRAKICDFNWSLDLKRTCSIHVGGTLSYLAPEQLDGNPSNLTPRTDVFGLGRVLQFLSKGGRDPRVTDDLSRLPFGHIIAKATATMPQHRYSACSEVLTDILAAAAAPPSRTRLMAELASDELLRWSVPTYVATIDRLFELSTCPTRFEAIDGRRGGWRPGDFILRDLETTMPVPLELTRATEAWKRDVAPEKLERDHDKFSVRNNPSSKFSQDNVTLELVRTKWSLVQATRTLVDDSIGCLSADGIDNKRTLRHRLGNTDWSGVGLPSLDLTKSLIHHAVGVHAIVLSSDNFIIASKRPEDADYYPGAWSITFEEQLWKDDLGGHSVADSRKWLERAVRREVLRAGSRKSVDVDEMRIASIGMHEENFSIFPIAIIPMSMTVHEVMDEMRNAPDRAEATSLEAVSLVADLDALGRVFWTGTWLDGTALHPSSRYRVLVALEYFYGPDAIKMLRQLQP